MEGCLSPYCTNSFNSSSRNLRIKDVIEDNKWNISFLQLVTSTFNIHHLQHISPLILEGPDRHIQNLEGDSKFSTKSFIQAIRTRGESWSPSVHIRDSCLPLKYSLFMWKLHNGFLGLDDIWKMMGFKLASQCGCKNKEDRIDHIFLHRKHASYLWRESARLLGISTLLLSSLNSIFRLSVLLVEQGKGNSLPLKFFPTIIYWALWKNHCSFYFDGTSNTNSQFWSSFLVLITDISKVKNWNAITSSSRETITTIRWKQPFHTYALILNVDGTSKGNPRLAQQEGL